MAKQTGVGLQAFSVDDAGGTPRDIRNNITNWDLTMPRGVQDTTGQDVLAMDRLPLLADSALNMTGVFDAAVNKSHDVFKTIPTTDVARTCTLDLGTPTIGNEYLLTDYGITRAQDGTLVFTVPGVLTTGVFNAWA